LLYNGRAQPLERFPRRRSYRFDRSCGSLGIHVSDLGSRRPAARRTANSAPKDDMLALMILYQRTTVCR
jgi:hypothetical protein